MHPRKAFVALALAGSIVAPSGAAEAPVPDVEGLALPPGLAARNAERAARAGDEQAGVRLVWLDVAGAASTVQGLARSECERVLQTLGVPVTWRKGDPSELGREDEIRVILLDRGAGDGRGGLVLGATPADFPVARFVWVHVPNVRSALGVAAGGGGRSSTNPIERRALGLALGRVIAHEIVHAVAPSIPHGDSGLMSRRLLRQDLVSASLRATPDVGPVLRAALRGEVAYSPEAAAVLAAEHVGSGQAVNGGQ